MAPGNYCSSQLVTILKGGECSMEDQNDDTLGNLNHNIVGKPPRDHSVSMRHCTSSSWLADSVSIIINHQIFLLLFHESKRQRPITGVSPNLTNFIYILLIELINNYGLFYIVVI